jgi:hypothetical protein
VPLGDDTIEVPVLGRVAAGAPLLAVENVEDTVKVDRFFLGGANASPAAAREVFALRVKGDSMIEDGIRDGDFIFVRKSLGADRGTSSWPSSTTRPRSSVTTRRRRDSLPARKFRHAANHGQETGFQVRQSDRCGGRGLPAYSLACPRVRCYTNKTHEFPRTRVGRRVERAPPMDPLSRLRIPRARPRARPRPVPLLAVPDFEPGSGPRPPKQEVEVTWIEKVPESPDIKLPPAIAAAEPEMVASAPPLPRPTPPSVSPPPPPPPTPEPPKKKPPEKIPELTIIPKPPPPKLVPPPPKPPEPEPPPEPDKPKPDLRAQQMKKVEVDDDEHVTDKPPPEAAYLSDKNRRVEQETRDTKTNLDKLSKGKTDASEKSEDKESEDIGGEDEKVRQLEKAEASSFEKKRLDPSVHSGKDQVAKGLQSGAKGEAATGEQGHQGDAGKPGALSMRDVSGRGAPGSLPEMSTAPAGAQDDAPEVAMSENPGEAGESGRAGRQGPSGKPGKRGPKLDLAMEDYKRIIGEEALREEIEIAKRQTSHRKGRWEQKRDRVHAALENFTPEVKPGNQTALGTRAAPFAVFIARMHRQIHELWGFGFLEDLDGKSPATR